MEKVKIRSGTNQFANQAWMRNGQFVVSGEALILACLLHSRGAGRDTDDMKDVQRIMRDVNLDKE